MNKRFIIRTILLLTISLWFGSCYDDKGNYDYTDLISLQIDTMGMKMEQTAYQFENFKIPVEIKYSGDEKDLSYEWKIYPQNPKKEDDVQKFDSAKILFTKPVFDTVMYELPGAYYLTLTVTDSKQDIKNFFTLKVNVETLLTRGLCVLDETAGIYDLHMIKTAKLLTDITASEEQIYYHVYSGVNDLPVTNGKFLAYVSKSKNKTLYLFTETGGAKLNINTYQVESSDFSSWFSFPAAITPAPSTYVLTNRPIEMLVNNGLIYKWDHSDMFATSFGDRLDGDYKAAPFLPNISSRSFSTVIFDEKNKRFAPLDIFASNVGNFESTPGAAFDLNNIGATKELKYMDNGFNSYTYSVFYDTQTSAYSLYVADFAGTAPTPVKVYSMNSCPGINENSYYAFGNKGDVCFYSSGSDLFQYKYASANTATVVHSFNGETITGMKLFKNSGHVQNGKLLFVYTVTGSGDGKVYLIGFNDLTGMIESGLDKPYTGFGKVVDVLYKE